MIHDNRFFVGIQISISEHLLSSEKVVLPHCSLKTHLPEAEMFNEWMLKTKNELWNAQIPASLISPLRNVALITSDIFKKSVFLPTQHSPSPLACGLLLVKKKGHSIMQWVTKRIHGKLVIRHYCLYRNPLRSWTNPIPYVSIDHRTFHGPLGGRSHTE